MRARKKKHGAERLEACAEYIAKNPCDITVKPVYLEIGCGKGTFVCESAKRMPDVQFVALEKVSDVLLVAAEKVKAAELPNVKFIIGDAKNITDYFKKGEVKRIYLNFSDPWPKAGHYKRRLTYKDFLEIYKSVLPDDGEIFFKTDNRGLFDFSLEQFIDAGFKLRNLTYDLHAECGDFDNIVTEYEKNFSEKGFKINRVEAYLG